MVRPMLLGPTAPTGRYHGLTWDDAMNRRGIVVTRILFVTAFGSVPTIEASIELTSTRTSKNGPVESRNHLEDLSPSLRDYVEDRCQREGIPVTSVRVVSPTEVIIP
jgi:hypothetical protein